MNKQKTILLVIGILSATCVVGFICLLAHLKMFNAMSAMAVYGFTAVLFISAYCLLARIECGKVCLTICVVCVSLFIGSVLFAYFGASDMLNTSNPLKWMDARRTHIENEVATQKDLQAAQAEIDKENALKNLGEPNEPNEPNLFSRVMQNAGDPCQDTDLNEFEEWLLSQLQPSGFTEDTPAIDYSQDPNNTSNESNQVNGVW